MKLWRIGAALAGIAAFVPGQVPAASPEPGDATYRALRYQDDFSYLSDPARSSDFWDPIKYVPIGDGPFGPAYATFGGELRERFESYANPNFGIKAPRNNAYGLQRLILSSDVHVTDYARIFVQLGSFERLGGRGVTSSTDIGRLAIAQGFVDLKPPSPLGDAPVVRIGREELLFGFQRLIAVREGPNIRRAFDGVRLQDHIGPVTIDLLAVRPVSNTDSVFGDHTNMKQSMNGVYASVALGGGAKADLYELNFENTAAKFRGLTGVEQRHTFGTRLFGEADGFDWNAEVALQSGTYRNKDIRANMLAGIAGYTFHDTMWSPRIGIEANYASGDSKTGSAIGTFNAMFPRLPYFAETSLLVPANIYNIRPVVSFSPAPDTLVTLGWDNLWRASSSDGLYGSGMALYANTNKATASRVGTELSADIRWRYGRHLQFGAIAAEFLSGPAVQQALGKDVTFLVLFATYRF